MTRRLLLSYLTLTAFVLLALEVPLGIFAAKLERRHLIDRARSSATPSVLAVEQALDNGQGIDPEVERLSEVIEGRVFVILDGEVVADSGAERGDPIELPEDTALNAQEEDEERVEFRHLANDDEVLDFALPLTVNGARGAMQLIVPADIVGVRTEGYWLILLAGGAAVLAIVFGVSIRLSRSLTRPLSDLEIAAEGLGAGDLSARAPVPTGPDEIRVLMRSFNDTATKLEQLVGVQRAFVADASHQLRTPLSALRLRLENIEAVDDPESREDIVAALAEVKRLSRLVDGLLALARAEGSSPARESVDVTAVIEDRKTAWSPLADKRRITLHAEVPARVHVRMSPGHLEQVVDNLVANAIEMSPPGSTVTVSAQTRNGSISLHVVDQGPGMGHLERRRAFDRFWRSPGARASGGGSGLGLAIVKQLVTADGGDVTLEEASGGGLDVTVVLQDGDGDKPQNTDETPTFTVP